MNDNRISKNSVNNEWTINFNSKDVNSNFRNVEVVTKHGIVVLNRDGFNILRNTSEIEFTRVCEKILKLLDE